MTTTLKGIKALELKGIYFQEEYTSYEFQILKCNPGKFSCFPWYKILKEHAGSLFSLNRHNYISMSLDVREYPSGSWFADYDIQSNWTEGVNFNKYCPYRGSYKLSNAEIKYLKELKQKELAK